MTIEPVYQQYLREPSDINEHLEFLHELVIGLDARQVIELGVRSGCSTAAFLAALEQTGGHLWSCDVTMHKCASQVATHPAWTFIQGDDRELAGRLPDADLVFIDTTHCYQHTFDELTLYGPKARQVIVLHDTELAHPDLCPGDVAFPVRRACADWHTLNPAWIWHEYRHNNGLGIFRRL